MSNDVRKLMHIYNEDENRDYLNKKQFRQLMRDLYYGLDGNRELTYDQLDSIYRMVDADGDGNI